MDARASMMKGKCIENTDRVLLPNGPYCVYGAQTGTRNGEYVAAGNRADGVSRNGAKAKLEYALKSARQGTMVIIGHARHRLSDLVEGRVACTRIGLE